MSDINMENNRRGRKANLLSINSRNFSMHHAWIYKSRNFVYKTSQIYLLKQHTVINIYVCVCI